jgi:hypothetical protein
MSTLKKPNIAQISKLIILEGDWKASQHEKHKHVFRSDGEHLKVISKNNANLYPLVPSKLNDVFGSMKAWNIPKPILLSNHLNTKTQSSNYQYIHTPANLIIDNNLVFNMRKTEVIKTHLS